VTLRQMSKLNNFVCCRAREVSDKFKIMLTEVFFDKVTDFSLMYKGKP